MQGTEPFYYKCCEPKHGRLLLDTKTASPIDLGSHLKRFNIGSILPKKSLAMHFAL